MDRIGSDHSIGPDGFVFPFWLLEGARKRQEGDTFTTRTFFGCGTDAICPSFTVYGFTRPRKKRQRYLGTSWSHSCCWPVGQSTAGNCRRVRLLPSKNAGKTGENWWWSHRKRRRPNKTPIDLAKTDQLTARLEHKIKKKNLEPVAATPRKRKTFCYFFVSAATLSLLSFGCLKKKSNVGPLGFNQTE